MRLPKKADIEIYSSPSSFIEIDNLRYAGLVVDFKFRVKDLLKNVVLWVHYRSPCRYCENEIDEKKQINPCKNATILML